VTSRSRTPGAAASITAPTPMAIPTLASIWRQAAGRMPACHRWASELGTTVPVIRRLLAQAGISRPPQPVMTARHRRRATDQRLTQQAARLGFARLEDYLDDRVVQQAWPLSHVAGDLGTHPRTMRDRLDRIGLRRERPTSGKTAGHERASARR
jgi:hypothetical protein